MMRIIDIGYGRADGRFYLPERGVAILNSRFVSSNETGVKKRDKGGKHAYLHQLNDKQLWWALI